MSKREDVNLNSVVSNSTDFLKIVVPCFCEARTDVGMNAVTQPKMAIVMAARIILNSSLSDNLQCS